MSGQQVKSVTLEGSAKYLRLLSGVPETRGMKSGYCILQPGESVGAHSTEAKEETIIVLEGVIQVCVDGKPVLTAKKDQVVYIPPQTVHDMTNTGEGAVRYVYVVSPVLPEGKC